MSLKQAAMAYNKASETWEDLFLQFYGKIPSGARLWVDRHFDEDHLVHTLMTTFCHGHEPQVTIHTEKHDFSDYGFISIDDGYTKLELLKDAWKDELVLDISKTDKTLTVKMRSI